MHVKNPSKNGHFKVIYRSFLGRNIAFSRHNRVHRHHLHNIEIEVHGGWGKYLKIKSIYCLILILIVIPFL